MPDTKKIKALNRIAYDPYDRIEHPTAEDWKKSYDALKELCSLVPDEGMYPDTLGYLCYYGRHTGGERQYEEARAWFEKGAALYNIESTYKLADMLIGGLGGPKDPERGLDMYLTVYLYCRNEFESGVQESKFADTALRLGRLYHEGTLLQRNDLEALGYLLEAQYALNWRKQFHHYGDDTVEQNIRKLIDDCEKPDEETKKSRLFGVGLGRVPRYLLLEDGVQMTVDIEAAPGGPVRLEFRRKRPDGKKPNRILWTVAPAMRVVMTDFVVLYGRDVRMIWNKNPGEQVICDRHEYDEQTDTNLFYLNDELQCRLTGGEYALDMDAFWMKDLEESPGTGIRQ